MFKKKKKATLWGERIKRKRRQQQYLEASFELSALFPRPYSSLRYLQLSEWVPDFVIP